MPRHNVIFFLPKFIKNLLFGITDSDLEKKKNLIAKCIKLSCFTPKPYRSNSKTLWMWGMQTKEKTTIKLRGTLPKAMDFNDILTMDLKELSPEHREGGYKYILYIFTW